jgi:superfamily I DNA and/or RNA helicase
MFELSCCLRRSLTLNPKSIVVCAPDSDASSPLYGVGVTAGFFDFIIIDEAAQLMESKVLSALQFANSDTTVVLTGDPKRMV